MNFTADRIDDRGVWLGDIEASENFDALNFYKINSIVTILDYQPNCRDQKRNYLTICAEDVSSTDLLTSEFEKTFFFIDSAIERGEQVLVHCQAGRSRSATIVTMFLMRKYSLTVDEALKRVKSKRIQSNVEINDGFLHQLELFYQMNFRVDPKNEKYLEFQQKRFQMRFSPNETKIFFGQNEKQRDFHCRTCQTKLFTNNDIQNHQTPSNSLCVDQENLWTFYIDWLDDIFDRPFDLLKCPNCRTILGKYSLQGIRCSCDQWIKPAFLFECRSIE